MTLEQKYYRILFNLTEYATFYHNDKVSDILTALSHWRYNIVNTNEFQTDEEYNQLIEDSLNNILKLVQ